MKLNKEQLDTVLNSQNYEKYCEIFPLNIVNHLFVTQTKYSKKDNFEDSIAIDNLFSGLSNKQVSCTITKIYCPSMLIEDNNYFYDLYEKFGLHVQYTEQQIDNFNKILKQISVIDNALEPLGNLLGIQYSVSLTGGAVRDFLTNKDISDLDILISTNYPNECILDKAKIKEGDTQEEKFENYYAKMVKGLKLLNLDNIKEKNNITGVAQLHYYLIHELINKNLSVDKIYNSFGHNENNENNEKRKESIQADKQIKDEDYNAGLLLGVIKLKKEAGQYPVDLLISHASVNNYNQGFDFNICKAHFEYTELNPFLKQNIFNNNISKEDTLTAINSIELNHEFLIDYLYKRLTFNFQKYTANQIKNSLTKHYVKVQNKYPDYKLYVEYDAFKVVDAIDSVQKKRDRYNALNKNLMLLQLDDFADKISAELKKELLIILNYTVLNQIAPQKDENTNYKRKKI